MRVEVLKKTFTSCIQTIEKSDFNDKKIAIVLFVIASIAGLFCLSVAASSVVANYQFKKIAPLLFFAGAFICIYGVGFSAGFFKSMEANQTASWPLEENSYT